MDSLQFSVLSVLSLCSQSHLIILIIKLVFELQLYHYPLLLDWCLRTYFVRMSVLPACLWAHRMCPWCPWSPEKRVGSPRTGVTGGYEPHCGSWEPNMELPSTLTSEPSLWVWLIFETESPWIAGFVFELLISLSPPELASARKPELTFCLSI